MPHPSSQLRLCAFPHLGPLGWRQPGARSEGDLDLSLYCHIAKTVEPGLFDALFLGDNVAVHDWHTGWDAADRIGNTVCFEPLTLLSALAMVTEHLGLMATASTTYNHPYHIARKFASLDHLSGGRAGWNVVTSRSEIEAANFGFSGEISGAARYERADEFVDVVNKLWDSWSDNAFVRDQATGRYYDKAGLHVADHRGKHFDVMGPLNIPRSPQGRPVICQAGRSEAGMDLAARTADLVFNNQHAPEASRRFRDEMRRRAIAHGRAPDDIRFMAGLFAVVGGTEEEAKRKLRDARDAVDMPTAQRFLAPFLPNVAIETLDPDLPPPDSEALRSDAAKMGVVLEENGRRLTVRELCSSHGNHWRQLEVIGTPEQVADLMGAWKTTEAADGFNIITLGLPGGFDDFVDGVVPELQNRGLFRTAYEGSTLRDNLGLARPAAPAP